MLIVPEDPGPDTIRVPVLKVFDGDGFLTRIERPRRGTNLEVTIRLGFIDAPEMGQPGGEQAKDFLQSLIGGKWVDLAILMKMDTGGIVDRHNRIVAVPYLKIDHQGPSSAPGPIGTRFFRRMSSPAFRNIELEMVLNGWAWVLDRYEPDQRYFEALEDAQRSRRGIWAFEDNLHPWEFKKRKYQARRSARPPTGQANLFTEQPERVPCPADGCEGRLIEKSGRYGQFVGCSNFPKCHYSRNLER
jgi:endonuclease YncB( thermonuclease family)